MTVRCTDSGAFDVGKLRRKYRIAGCAIKAKGAEA